MSSIEGGRFRIFSGFPWPNRASGGPQDELEQELLHRIVELEESEVVLERKGEAGNSLVYAAPVVMQTGCVECHNTRSDSPRRGWKVGDIRGVQLAEVQLPAIPFVPSGAALNSVLTLGGAAILALLGFLFLGHRLNSVSAKSEKLRLMHQVAQSMRDGIICLDADGIVTEFNHGSELLLGYSRDEVIGQPATMFMNAEDQVAHVAGMKRLFKLGETSVDMARTPAEVCAVSKSGEQIPVSMVVSLVRGVDRPQAVGTLRDLRPRQKHLRVSSFLEATFNSIDEGVSIYDEDLRLVSWNKRYAEFNDQVNPELLSYGTRLHDIFKARAADGAFGDGDPEEIAQARVEQVRNGKVGATGFLSPSPDQTLRINRTWLPNGGICVTFRDVTDERRIEDDLRQAQKMEAVGRLAGGIAHDINNILMVILGNAEMLLSRKPDKELKDNLHAGNRCAEITHRLLAFSRKQPLKPETIQLGQLFESLMILLRTTLGERVDLETEVPETLWACKADRAQLEGALLNLSANARDAMTTGGCLRIEARNRTVRGRCAKALGLEDGEYISIVVSDTGEGMTPEILSHAFDPFYTTKELGEGTGLGLAMVHGFAKQSEGAISIASGKEGTSVEFFVPRCLGSSPRPEPRSDQAPTGDFEGLVVLVVEDDEAVRSLVASQLEILGYKTLVADCGSDAMVHLRSDAQIDLMLTDMILPGEHSGWTLAGAARDVRPDLPTIFMSGYSEDALGQKGQLDYRSTLLRKPFRLTELSEALRTGFHGNEEAAEEAGAGIEPGL